MSDLGYMEKLLDGVDFEWKTLADVTLPTSNIKWRDIDHTHRYIDLSSVSIETKKIIETSEVDATNAPSRAQKIVQEGDVIFATTRPTQMRYCLIDGIYSGEVASTGYCVLRPQISKVLPKWILYCIASKRFKSHVENNESGAAYPAISDTKVKAFEIPVPPLNIQAEIIQILDTFTELTAELVAELVARKQQYGYYRDQLLTFEEDDIEWKDLGELATLRRGRVMSKGYLVDNIGNYPVYSSQTANNGEIGKINTFDFEGEYVNWTTDGANAGTVFYRTGKFSTTNVSGLIKINDTLRLNYKYLFYWLSIEAKKHVNSGMGNPKLMSNQVEKIPVPIPSLSKQKNIVAILDKFDALTTSLTEGLPREIALRQQQYEYYRELLLSFPKTEVANHD